jgi:hypothetical protein
VARACPTVRVPLRSARYRSFEYPCGSPGRSTGGGMETLTRRSLLVRAGGAGALLAFPALAAAQPKTVSVFKLDTGCGDGACACAACKAHDANSLFPSGKTANGNRAHVGCNCVVVEGTLDRGAYIALFGDPDRLRVYRADRRDRKTAAVLRQHPPTFP